MPFRRFKYVYVKHLPRLRAEETLSAITASSIPYIEEREAKRIIRRLERMAQRKSLVESQHLDTQASKERDERRKRAKLLKLKTQFGNVERAQDAS